MIALIIVAEYVLATDNDMSWVATSDRTYPVLGTSRAGVHQKLRQEGLFMRINPIALMLLSCFMGCGISSNGRPQEANAVSLDPQKWDIYYSAGMPPHPTPDTDGAWSFEFPTSQTGGHVNYVQTPFNTTTLLHNVSISFRVESSTPQYTVLDPSDISPATIHVFIDQQGDDLVNPNGRWWAHASGYNLGSRDGEPITFSVQLTPDQWSNVNGKYDPHAFYAALHNIGWVGLTCGGQYFWGHGVGLDSGTAKFVLIDFHVD